MIRYAIRFASRITPVRLVIDRLNIFAVFLILLLLPVAAGAAQVDNLRLGVHPDKIRMVLDLEDIGTFRAFMMKDPYRLAIDLPSFDWHVGRVSKPPGANVKGVRQGPLTPAVSRIVVDLDRPALIHAASIIPGVKPGSKRLVIDFDAVSADAFASGKDKIFGTLQDNISPSSAIAFNAPLPQPVPVWRKAAAKAEDTQQDDADANTHIQSPGKIKTVHAIAETKDAIAELPQDKSTRAAPALAPGETPLIVIDPGHGGIDPGSLGVNGLFEKNVTIGMARELKKELEATGRYRVLMTRNDDTYVKLSDRVAFAREHHANLFVSLHADSISRPGVQGASIYTLSDKASDEQTAKLAQRENSADVIGGVDIGNQDNQVASILIDLVTRDNMNQSKFFSSIVMENLHQHGVNLLEHTERSAGFAVLKAPDIPSVLIELGFMTSATESALLMSDDYRQKVSNALVAGINGYFAQVGQGGKT